MPRRKQKLDTPMTEKVKIVAPTENEGMLSMIVGTVLVALGILLFVVGVVMFVLYYLPPREDKNVTKPILYELPETTNSAKLSIKGESDSDKVMVWVNDELVNGGLKTEEKLFSLDYPVTSEGNYKVEVASLKGFPIRLRSEKTTPVVVMIDWTAPSKNIVFSYDSEVDRQVFTLKGKGEPNTTVTIKNGNKEYSGKTDSSGNFEIKDIPLTVGGNTFSAIVEDKAGNSTRVDKSVKVVYAMGDINGEGVTDLPESAGLFSNELAYNLGNTLLTLFGLSALVVFGFNMYLVRRKLNN